jgi:hypothetical protein
MGQEQSQISELDNKMGQQESQISELDNKMGQQESQISEWDIRARGGCDMDQITEDIRREYGKQGLDQVKNQIYYLAAHGIYSNRTEMIDIPDGLTIVHLSAFSSSVDDALMKDFAKIPIEKKIALLRYPNCASILLKDLERNFAFDQGKEYQEKQWGESDNLNLIMYQNKVPNIVLEFVGELSNLESIKKDGQSDFFFNRFNTSRR